MMIVNLTILLTLLCAQSNAAYTEQDMQDMQDALNLGAICNPTVLPLALGQLGVDGHERRLMACHLLGDQQCAVKALRRLEKTVPESAVLEKYRELAAGTQDVYPITQSETGKAIFKSIGKGDELTALSILAASNESGEDLWLATSLALNPGMYFNRITDRVLMTGDLGKDKLLADAVRMIKQLSDEQLTQRYKEKKGQIGEEMARKEMYAHAAAGKLELAGKYAKMVTSEPYVEDAVRIRGTFLLCSSKYDKALQVFSDLVNTRYEGNRIKAPRVVQHGLYLAQRRLDSAKVSGLVEQAIATGMTTDVPGFPAISPFTYQAMKDGPMKGGPMIGIPPPPPPMPISLPQIPRSLPPTSNIPPPPPPPPPALAPPSFSSEDLQFARSALRGTPTMERTTSDRPSMAELVNRAQNLRPTAARQPAMPAHSGMVGTLSEGFDRISNQFQPLNAESSTSDDDGDDWDTDPGDGYDTVSYTQYAQPPMQPVQPVYTQPPVQPVYVPSEPSTVQSPFGERLRRAAPRVAPQVVPTPQKSPFDVNLNRVQKPAQREAPVKQGRAKGFSNIRDMFGG